MTLRERSRGLPLRLRLVAGFSTAMVVVLITAGGFVYWRVAYALDRSLDTDLARATTTITAVIGPTGEVEDRATADATGVVWQVVDADGTVVDHGGPTDTNGTDDVAAMVPSDQLGDLGTAPLTLNVGDFLPGTARPYRVRVTGTAAVSTASVTDPGRYVVVAARRDHRDEALRELLLQLTLAGLGALVITAFVGDRLARAALRPVERYRRQAEDIAAGDAELRLDVPPGRDDEITRLGHTFNRMLAALEAALERERRFVGEASHELRTPITLLGSRIQLALRRPRSVAEHERTLAELQVDLDRLAALAEQLLQLEEADVGRPGAVSDLRSVLARVIDRRRLADPKMAGAVSVVTPARPCPVPLTDVATERILTNLLDNALRHGQPPVTLVLDAPEPGWFRITFSDSGPGMPSELLGSATQRFTRAKEARSRPGAGLGLALVDGLVTRSGGELRLCHGGHHQAPDGHIPVACSHGPAMTVTVLLPSYDAPESSRSSSPGLS